MPPLDWCLVGGDRDWRHRVHSDLAKTLWKDINTAVKSQQWRVCYSCCWGARDENKDLPHSWSSSGGSLCESATQKATALLLHL
jgi:hypothetical protein